MRRAVFQWRFIECLQANRTSRRTLFRFRNSWRGKRRATHARMQRRRSGPGLKHVIHILAVMFLARTPMLAQTGPTGTWIVEGVGREFPWEAVLRADGPNRLLGAVNSCSSSRRAIEIFEGNFEGNTISFKCLSVDRQRTVTLTGKISGDE